MHYSAADGTFHLDEEQAFALAVEHRDAAAGQAFSVTGATALNVRGFATIAAGWFGREASLRSATWEEFRAETSPEWGESSWQHLSRSQCRFLAASSTGPMPIGSALAGPDRGIGRIRQQPR